MSETLIYTQYRPMERQNRYNQKIVRSAGEAMALVNGALAVYAGCRRNQQVVNSLYPPDSYDDTMTILNIGPGQTKTILVMPADGMIAGGFPLTAYVYYATSHDDRAMSFELTCGTGSGITRSVESTSFGWSSVTCYPEQSPVGAPDQRTIQLQITNEDEADSEDIVVNAISIFEEPNPNAPAWLNWDTATNKVGATDEPFSSAMMAIMKSNLDHIAETRLPRANVFNRCFINNKRTTENAYEANEDGLGRYVVRTKPDITSLEVMIHVDVEGTDLPAPDDPQATYKVGAYNMAGVLIDSVEILFGGPMDHFGQWGQDTLDISGRTAGDDTIEIRVDSKETNGTVDIQMLWNLAILEWPPDSDITYELPNPRYVQPDDDVRAADLKNAKDVLTHLYYTGVQILANDLRVEAPAKHQAFTPDGYHSSFGMFRFVNTYLSNDYCARGVLYPSPGSKTLVFDVWLQRPGGQDMNIALAYSAPDAGFENALIATNTDVTGGTSGAKARIVSIDAGSNILYLERSSGSWQAGETITETSTSATATVSRTGYKPDSADVDLNVYVDISYGTPFAPRSQGVHVFEWDTINIGRQSGPIHVRAKLEIPTDTALEGNTLNFWTALYNAVGTPIRSGIGTYSRDVPICFTVMAHCTTYEWNRPYVRLVKVYEEVPGVL